MSSCAPTTAAVRCSSSRALEAVATRAQFYSDRRVAHPAIIDGAAGFVATEAGRPVAVLAFTVADGRITAIDALHGPARLATLSPEVFAAG